MRFRRTFQPGKLTLGLIAPFKGYPDSPSPKWTTCHRDKSRRPKRHFPLSGCAMCRFTTRVLAMSRRFTTVGNAGLSRRAHPKRCARLGGLCFALREPILTAKEAASAERQRRPLPARLGQRRPSHRNTRLCRRFQQPRRTLYREAWQIIRRPDAGKFPAFNSEHYGRFSGNLDLVPKPAHGLPMLAMAAPAKSWNGLPAKATHGFGTASLPKTGRHRQHAQRVGDGGNLKPFGVSNFVELLEDPNAPAGSTTTSTCAAAPKSIVEFGRNSRPTAWHTHYREQNPTARRAGNHSDFAENVIPHFAVRSWGFSGCLKC